MSAKKYNNIKLFVSVLEAFSTFILVLLFVSQDLSTLLLKKIESNFSNEYLVFFAFAIIALLIIGIIFSPLSYYSGYYLEHKYELSNQTFGKWLIENLKGFMVSAVIGIPILFLFFFLIRTVGEFWWFYFAFALFFISVIMAQILPIIILPLFYKISPIENEELKNRIYRLADKVNLKVNNIYKFDMSKNTKKANAAFTGLGKTKRIILGDTLIEQYNIDEIESVIAHEMGHYKHKHIFKNILLGTLNSFLSLYLINLLYMHSIVWFGFSSFAQIDAFPLLIIWSMIIGIISTPLTSKISRIFEHQADRFACKNINDKEIFISTLEKITEQNLGDKEPHPFVEWFFYSHPSLINRIRYINSVKK